MSKWIKEFADNGWVDWICPKCGWCYNDDIHVRLDYKYCPMCGERMVDDGEEVAKNNQTNDKRGQYLLSI